MRQKLEVIPADRRRWQVKYEDDPTPISEHETLAEAENEARSHGSEFGIPIITIWELDGEKRTVILDPEHDRGATIAEVKGPTAT